MITFDKAKKLISTWIEILTDGECEIGAVDDKPYGWVFYYISKKFNPDDPSTIIAGNAPIIFDRIDGELRVTGTAHDIDHYLLEYEATLPEARLTMNPEKSGFVSKYE